MNFKDIKVAFFDVDGTIFSHNTMSISKDTINALKELKKNNIKICVATGRPKDFLDMLKDYLDEIEFDYYITNNGQAIFDNKHNIIYKNYLHPDDVKAIIKKANELDLCVSVIGEQYSYASKLTDIMRGSFEYLDMPIPSVKKLDESFNLPVDNLVCYESIEYMKYFKKVINHSVITYWTDQTFDFVPNNGVKVNGIKKILKHLNYTSENAIAFGDGQNDLDMLEFVGFGVAMKNSSIEVQEAADYVCESVDDDGVLKTLKKIKLI